MNPKRINTYNVVRFIDIERVINLRIKNEKFLYQDHLLMHHMENPFVEKSDQNRDIFV